MTLYNCRHSGDQYRITKFTPDLEVESSYLCDRDACECPSGHRPKCRHREMLPKFIARDHIGDEFFFDYNRGGWVQGMVEAEPRHPPAVDSAEGDALAPQASALGVEPALAAPSAFIRRRV